MSATSAIGPMVTLAATAFTWLPAHADVDAAIVFAVDVSASVDPATADLQREGHAAALVSPEVIAAIARNRIGCIAITYVEWGSPGQVRSVAPWTRVCVLSDARAVAALISKDGDRGYGCHSYCGTSISFAIDLGGMLFDRYAGYAARRIIDISANGTNNDGLPVEPSRLRAIAKGYTINAIAIPPRTGSVTYDLVGYFSENVIGGPNAFVIAPASTRDYATALRRKLVDEISLSIDAPGRDVISAVSRN